MKEKHQKSKYIGQVFTPRYLVENILDYCNYMGTHILRKHLMDNSCGDGAFLSVAVERYCAEALLQGCTVKDIKNDLETYVHGIDTDAMVLEACRKNLSDIAKRFGIDDVHWDLYNQDALSLSKFDGEMDYVVGNPPYVRVHNLDKSYNDVKKFRFANGGMTDLYLAFFELGFKMLGHDGILGYITPSSWLNSVAALNMRHYILMQQNLLSLTDLGHFQPFNATAYTIISIFSKSKHSPTFEYYTYNGELKKREHIETLSLDRCCIDHCFYLGDSMQLDKLRRIKTFPAKKIVRVKNGFATLADDVFIGKDIPASNITIRVLKASTGKWYHGLFPYDRKGKILPPEIALQDHVVKQHFSAHKQELLKGRPDYPTWYEYGRTQALLDVWRDKLALNSLCRTAKDVKITFVGKGEGLYSGLYLTTDYDISYEEIAAILQTDDFVEYVKMLKKYKSGGYYTYNSKDVEQYINSVLTYKSTKKYELINKPRISQCCLELF